MAFFRALRDFFAGLFARDPAEAHRRKELKRIHQFLASRRPALYRPSHRTVQPGFAGLLFGYCQLLRSVSDIVKRTIGSSDLRQAQKFYDLLIDSRLPTEHRARKEYFAYEGMRERVQAAMDPEEELEAISREFQGFMKALESPQVRAFDVELVDMERIVDLCRHDYERLLGLFDPGVNVDNVKYRPDFSPCAGDTAAPELIDLYYVTGGFVFTTRMEDNLAVLLDRISVPEADREAQRTKLSKVLGALNRCLRHDLGGDVLLALLRAIKGEPGFTPDTGRARTSFLDSYKNRAFTQFQRDKDRIQRERHEDSLAQEIKALFPDREVLEMESYNEENSALLSRDSPESFSLVKPMRIMKTFVLEVFERELKEPVKKVLVEGYFDNKAFQNNMANVFFQCEHSADRLALFEEQLSGNGRVSVVAMKRYLEEARRGKDIMDFLGKLVDGINAKAGELIENETSLFSMLAESLVEIAADFKRPAPELVANVRTLGGARNKDLIAAVAAGAARIDRLVKVMRNFTAVRSPISGEAGEAGKSEPADLEEIGQP
jgi:hypothetical protein